MKQQYKNLVAIIALVLVSAKGRADSVAPNGGENLNSIIERIQSNIQSEPELASVLPTLTKFQLEDLIEQDLSDEGYTALREVILGLAGQNVSVEIVKPGVMILGSQEIFGKTQ